MQHSEKLYHKPEKYFQVIFQYKAKFCIESDVNIKRLKYHIIFLAFGFRDDIIISLLTSNIKQGASMTAKRTRKSIDKDKLFKLVKDGKTAQEIMKALGINLKQSLKSALFDLSVEKNEILSVPGMTARATGNRKITKMGISVPMSQLEGSFAIGDKFELSVEKDKIVLKKV